ncbi:MAG: hypothetical protein MJZ41_14355 [Bacteroidaceae bacterium]|nr:hypothetical protein [Bacteroidaceae bacterium]
MAKKEIKLESVLDLNSNNVWTVTAHEIAERWEVDKAEEDFRNSEDKLLNTIRLCFEVVHYNPDDQRDVAKYESGEWATFSHVDVHRGNVAIRKKDIKRITDLSYENIQHISAALLLDLIDRNFGGGWDAIQLSVKDIIESGFDISTTTLPTSRLHTPGGTYERKVNAGYEVLEVAKGNWTEAIFAKKKDPVAKVKFQNDSHYDEDGNLIVDDVDGRYEKDNDFDDSDEIADDETFYSSYSAEAGKRSGEDDEDLGGLSLDEGDDED